MPLDDDERARICYEQNFEQLRSLNTQMNHIPTFAMTLTGGLWFGAGVVDSIPRELKFLLLVFAGLCNLALILAMIRVRDVIESYLEKIKSFSDSSFADGRPAQPKAQWLGSYSMITLYAALMVVSALLSFLVAIWKYRPFSTCVGVVLLGLLLLAMYLGVFKLPGWLRPKPKAPEPTPKEAGKQ
ncbi:MAG: hypothetical protein HS108_14620 [Planctomycetes bacterium]|nr:hypothetical protein [Planctomycetota bacterium]